MVSSDDDGMRSAGKEVNGNDVMLYKEQYKDAVYYAEEVRNRRMELMSKTLWKTRTASDALHGRSPRLVNVQNDSRNLPDKVQ